MHQMYSTSARAHTHTQIYIYIYIMFIIINRYVWTKIRQNKTKLIPYNVKNKTIIHLTIGKKNPNRHIKEFVNTRSYLKRAQRIPKGACFTSTISRECLVAYQKHKIYRKAYQKHKTCRKTYQERKDEILKVKA